MRAARADGLHRVSSLNASIHLLRKSLAPTVHLRTEIPESHASAGILGTERMGTGTLVGASGVIVTAHYVLIGASRVEVVWGDGTAVAGQVAAVDHESGLGAVMVGTAPVHGLSIAPPDEIAPGQELFVIGSVGDGRRVACGILTAIGPFDAFWEYMLDQALFVSAENPGVGGGPVIDAQGRMVGISALTLAEVGRFTMAIPAQAALPILEQIRQPGGFSPAMRRPWLGITCYTLRSHLVIAGVIPDSPAALAGLEPGDVILALDGTLVHERRELYERLWQRLEGDDVALRVFRNSSTIEVSVRTSSMEAFFA